MKETILLLIFGFLCFTIGYSIAKPHDSLSQTQTQVNAQTANFSLDQLTPTPSSSGSISSSGSVFNNSNATPTPTRETTNAFAYTPLPAQSPAADITEVSPLSANRTSVQVDDSVTFSVTIKNQASYNKHIQTLCFESSDGNIGCVWGIYLAPGQTTTIQNVGTWVHPGFKSVWVTWTGDGVNYYTPVNANSITVNVLG